MKSSGASRFARWRKKISRRLPVSAAFRRPLLMVMSVVFILFCLLVLSSFLVWIFEDKGTASSTIRSFWDGIWWAIVTVATVGYGDKVPITPYGRLVGMVLIGVGFTLLSVFTGLVASLFVEERMKGAKGLKQIRYHDHLVICGWNKTAEFLLKALQERKGSGQEICLLMNQPPEFFESVESRFPGLDMAFVRGELSNEEVLRRAGVQNAALVIILPDQHADRQSADDRSIIIANAMHYLVGRDKIIVQLHNTENRSMLQRIGIANILIFDDIAGYILANSLSEPHSLQFFSHLAKTGQERMRVCEIAAGWVGKSYGEYADHMYKEQNRLPLGLMTRVKELEIDSIFKDDTSAIDQFIRSTLARSGNLLQEEKDDIRWKPDRDYVIQDTDYAILMV